MRSIKAYTITAEALASEVAEIQSGVPYPDPIERAIALETAQNIGARLADEFEHDNPNGFDRERFLADSLTNTI